MNNLFILVAKANKMTKKWLNLWTQGTYSFFPFLFPNFKSFWYFRLFWRAWPSLAFTSVLYHFNCGAAVLICSQSVKICTCTYWLSERAGWENIWLKVMPYGPSTMTGSQRFSSSTVPDSVNKLKCFIIWPLKTLHEPEDEKVCLQKNQQICTEIDLTCCLICINFVFWLKDYLTWFDGAKSSRVVSLQLSVS